MGSRAVSWLRIEERLEGAPAASVSLTLPFELRQKSRLRARLDDGSEAGLVLPRGAPLRGGDRLRAADGRIVEVRAAPEKVSEVRSADARTLARAAYHLGNRHVPVEVGEGFLRYAHDHVLDDMLRGLGLEVTAAEAPFEPEAGAYGGGHHHHHHHDARDHDGGNDHHHAVAGHARD